MNRKDGKPKVARGTYSRVIEGVKHNRCEYCKLYLPPSAYKAHHSLGNWVCVDCDKKSLAFAFGMMIESATKLNEMGINPYELIVK